ncbi:uncharacterized protein LOC112685020 isoform X2 [Sipha flava]|uniref:Uncharacterized protein LOC112685020 isoform X2 n=1 Tax=Sipha flava TaxID=143950 RepID=A0A8B8FQE1_9HEMI|nr:uncharacterized protein LOC112685020 isoform X2 [Sipha flava]
MNKRQKLSISDFFNKKKNNNQAENMNFSIEPFTIDSELYNIKEIRRLYDLFDVISVHKVQNPLLWGLYTLKKNEMEFNDDTYEVNEWLLYHVTATKNVQSIAENNLDWRYTSRCRYGKGSTHEVEYDENLMHKLLTMGFPKEAVKKALFFTFNQGIDQATKWLLDHITDHNYAETFVPSRRNFNNEMLVERAFIICRVLVQKIKDISVNYGLNMIPNSFDTALSKNGMVYVKFNDYEFYPQYIVYYREHNVSQYVDKNSYNFNSNQNCYYNQN